MLLARCRPQGRLGRRLGESRGQSTGQRLSTRDRPCVVPQAAMPWWLYRPQKIKESEAAERSCQAPAIGHCVGAGKLFKPMPVVGKSKGRAVLRTRALVLTVLIIGLAGCRHWTTVSLREPLPGQIRVWRGSERVVLFGPRIGSDSILEGFLNSSDRSETAEIPVSEIRAVEGWTIDKKQTFLSVIGGVGMLLLTIVQLRHPA